jgi:phenylacetate-coenzyme A ligase PaaK-like adenylate-forming protein
MNLKSILAKPFASFISKQVQRDRQNAIKDQNSIFENLIKSAAQTQFGKDHQFSTIKNHADFVKQVPIRDYELFRPFIDEIKLGKQNILWKGSPIYLAKTSGTTSGVKYIPITKESIHNHINTARNALLCYMAETGKSDFASGKLIFLSGSPTLERIGNIPTGRLSGIVNHHVPKYLRSNQLPSFETNCIEEWETKLEKIVEETVDQNMSLISGIPPWMQMYFDKLTERTGKKIGELFPNLQVLVQGGVNFEPYKNKLIESVGRPIDIIELFPASEGFFAFQDSQKEKGLLLNTNSGIFFEFVPVDEIHNENPTRLPLQDVKVGVNYALIISNNAGLWAYNIGDTVKFVSVEPYKLIVSGRIKHYISAFGEHVIGEEVENAMMKTVEACGGKLTEFTVAPCVSETDEKSYHEWFVEFEQEPGDLNAFAIKLDECMQAQNVYYKDLITGNILSPLKLTTIQKNGFVGYMKSIGKLGGQNKVPRLSNDRKIASDLMNFKK